jgi:hypothetical protein
LPCIAAVPEIGIVVDGGAEGIALQLSLRLLEESGTVWFLCGLFSLGLMGEGWSVTVTVITAAGRTGMVFTLVASMSMTVIGRGGVGKRMPNA